MARAKKLPYFCRRLRELREQKNLSHADMERLTGITDQAIINMEDGALPRLDRAMLIAVALEVDLNDLSGPLPPLPKTRPKKPKRGRPPKPKPPEAAP